VQTALNRDYISVDDYLAGEETSDLKHEYVGGNVYAMAGATTEHNQIAMSIAFVFRSHVKGKRCRTFMSDVKVQVETAGESSFYYPDVMVGFDSRDTHQLYLCFPKVLVEVSSESTERLDRGEKRLACQTIETLEEYLIVAQDRPEVTIFRKTNRWTPETIAGSGQSVSLKSLDLSLALSAIYEGVSKPGS
jgi:Uma2 family endonuclease